MLKSVFPPSFRSLVFFSSFSDIPVNLREAEENLANFLNSFGGASQRNKEQLLLIWLRGGHLLMAAFGNTFHRLGLLAFDRKQGRR
jgi:hypothetical protein